MKIKTRQIIGVCWMITAIINFVYFIGGYGTADFRVYGATFLGCMAMAEINWIKANLVECDY